MRLPELQDDNKKVKKLRSEELPERWKDIKNMFYYLSLPYVLTVIYSELISRHLNDPLVSYFGIEMTQELIAKKFYLPTLQRNVEAYIKGCDVCLALKAICHKP